MGALDSSVLTAMKKVTLIIIAVLVVLGAVGFMLMNRVTAPASEPPFVSSLGDITPAQNVHGAFMVDTEASVVRWSGSKTFIQNYVDTGTIRVKSGTATITDGVITSGKLIFDMRSITVDATGIGENEPMLAQHLKSSDFFSVEEYPEASFAMTSAVPDANDPNRIVVTGNLTIKNNTNPLSVPLQVGKRGDALVVFGRAEVDRTLWDIRFGSGTFFKNLGDAVIDDRFLLDFELVAEEQDGDVN